MKRAFGQLMILFSFCAAHAQKINWEKLDQLKPDRILLAGERKPAKVLLLGSFHFGYPNLDTHKTDSAKFIDVLSPTRQKELDELLSVISRYKATRIYVEGMSQDRMDSLYNNYLQGKSQLRRNENRSDRLQAWQNAWT
jgi:hypothetical protein